MADEGPPIASLPELSEAVEQALAEVAQAIATQPKGWRNRGRRMVLKYAEEYLRKIQGGLAASPPSLDAKAFRNIGDLVREDGAWALEQSLYRLLQRISAANMKVISPHPIT